MVCVYCSIVYYIYSVHDLCVHTVYGQCCSVRDAQDRITLQHSDTLLELATVAIIYRRKCSSISTAVTATVHGCACSV
jgi:hypothetical protein